MKIKNIALKLLPEKLLNNLKKVHYVHALTKFSDKDEPDIEIIKSIVRQGDRVIDLGANIGWYTKILSSLVGDEGMVYCIEPIPTSFELLTHCIKKLKLKNVDPLNFAVSDREGYAAMEVPLYENGGENYYQAQIIMRNGKNEVNDKRTPLLKQYKIALKSVDKLFSELPGKIAFIKCDVEGHELAVIRGAKEVIKTSRPAWFIEVSGNPDDEHSDAYKLFNILQKQGYSACWFDGKVLHRRVKGDNSVNYFFLQDNHLSLIGRHLLASDSLKS